MHVGNHGLTILLFEDIVYEDIVIWLGLKRRNERESEREKEVSHNTEYASYKGLSIFISASVSCCSIAAQPPGAYVQAEVQLLLFFFAVAPGRPHARS